MKDPPRNQRTARPHRPMAPTARGTGVLGSWIIEAGGGGGGTPSGPDNSGPVTGFTTAHEVGTRYADAKDRLEHMTVGFTPVLPTPQPVTYLISHDNGANWTWIGAQRMHADGQELKVDQLAPGQNSTWMVAAVAGNQGGDPSPIADANLDAMYPGIVRSASFPVAGLLVPAAATGITATIGSCSNVVSADGFTQYGVIPGVVYTDPVASTAFFVRITVRNLDSNHNPLTPEQAYGGTQITGGSHTEKNLLITYIPGLAYMEYRFYLANRNSQGDGDFANPATNTLQQVKFNGSPTTADHYDVPVTVPTFPSGPGGVVFNVRSVSASEVGPKHQDEKAGLHTVIGIVPVIDIDYSSPRTVTIWTDRGTGVKIWEGPYALTAPGEVVRIGDATLATDGTRLAGNVWVPANTAQGNWQVWCGPGSIDKGVDPSGYAHSTFTVVPVAACSPTGTTAAQFVASPDTGNPIIYSKWDPGIWYWEFYELTWTPPTLNQEPNYWFTLLTVQKGHWDSTASTWTPAPDAEGRNEDPSGQWLGRVMDEVMLAPGTDPNAVAVMRKFGANPATWVIPPAQNPDLTPNIYTDFRFLIYNVSRLGTDASGSGGAGTYTRQTICWPGGTDHFILTPSPQGATLDIRAANPKTIELPLTGGNGQPLTVTSGGITSGYLGPQSVTSIQMAQDAITTANKALAANSVVNNNINDVSVQKFTAGTCIFQGDVILSRGPNNAVIVLSTASGTNGITLFGQADASVGSAGLTSKPYVQIQNVGIKLYTGLGGSIFLDASNNAITIYDVDSNTTKPYFTVTSTGLTLVNGVCSVAINSNAINFTDTGNHNSLTMNSAGITVASGASNPPNNQLVITSGSVQLQLGGQSRVTIDVNGTTVSDGGQNSVVTAATGITIRSTASSQMVLTSANIKITQGGSFTTIDSNGIRAISGAQCVRISSGVGVQLWASWNESTQAGDTSQPYIGLESSTGNIYIGPLASINANGTCTAKVFTSTASGAGVVPFNLACEVIATAGAIAGYRQEIIGGVTYKVALYHV